MFVPLFRHSYSRAGVRAIVVVLSCLISSGAFAQSNTTLTFVSEPGDYIGQGRTLSFTTVDATSHYGGQVIQVNAHGPASYSLYMISSAVGEPLTPGVYEVSATSQRPDFTFSGDGRGCNAVGRFEIIEAVFDQNGQAERFRANFEQHCDRASNPGLFGEVSVIGPPKPRVEIDFQVDDEIALNRVTGVATLTGTVRCSLPTTMHAFGNLYQEHPHFGPIGGEFFMPDATCSPVPRSWSVEIDPEDVPGFPLGLNRGAANVNTYAYAWDPNYYSETFSMGEHPALLVIDND